MPKKLLEKFSVFFLISLLLGIGVPDYPLYFCEMMEIDENTLIAEVINENNAAIEELAGINANFNKLRNPVLRKMFIANISITQAAAVGGVHPNIILNKLKDIGFKVNYPNI